MRTRELSVTSLALPLQIGLVLIATILLPLFVHLIPAINGIPTGAYLIPFFYAPLIAVYLFKPLTVATAGFIAPYIYHLISGAPAINISGILSLEIVSFVYLMFIMNSKFNKASWIAPAAYLMAKVVSFLILLIIPVSLISGSPIDFLFTSTLYAVPGIFILYLINLLMRKV